MFQTATSRRQFIRDLGVSTAALPFLLNLPSLGFANQAKRKQRMVVLFSPNGVIPKSFWPDEEGSNFQLKDSVKPLEPFRNKTLFLHGVADRIRGDGDAHMRGIGCLLTGIELFPGNIQGGSHTPAGWSTGISIDQELKNFLQKDAATRTRFGSLEFGVFVPDRADTWTRMSYAGANKPIAPIDDPYQMLNKLYGKTKDREALKSILDDLQSDLKKIGGAVSAADKKLLEEHAAFVRDMEKQLAADESAKPVHAMPALPAGVREENDNIPKISRMQIELLVNSLANDFTRIATFQFTNSVGMAKMKWIGVNEGHHELSHEPFSNTVATDKLTKINRWYCEEIAYLAKRLAETPEPGGTGSLLDNTTLIWTNELGEGNSHTLENIPWVLIGNGLNFAMGKSIKYGKQGKGGVPHNRLLLSIAQAFGHNITKFGNPDYCGAGPLALS